MKRDMQNTIKAIGAIGLADKKITVGFDASTDMIFAPVKKREAQTYEVFSSMADFGQYISDKDGVSCALELAPVVSKVGGNCPIFSEAISRLGADTSAIGLFGENRIKEEFLELSKSFKMYSYGENMSAFALEFKNGKIILTPTVKFEKDAWDCILDSIKEVGAYQIFAQADMLALLNWSELEFSTRVWRAIHELLCGYPDCGKPVIIDLADCTSNSKAQIDEMLEVIGRLSNVRKVILSLNENEAIELGKHFSFIHSDYGEIGRTLAKNIEASTIVIHSAKSCYTFEDGEIFQAATQFCPEPKLLTGAGDNFNAGYAMGCLMGLCAQSRNILGNATSSFYINHGVSPGAAQLKNHIETWEKEFTD